MDHERIEQLRKMAQAQVDTATRYANIRRQSGNAESDLKILLTARLKELRGNKKNLGIEMAILIMCEEDTHAQELFQEWQRKEAEYKGLERILDAQASQLMFEQSVMRYQREGEKYG